MMEEAGGTVRWWDTNSWAGVGVRELELQWLAVGQTWWRGSS
jgi:hypothetical protein